MTIFRKIKNKIRIYFSQFNSDSKIIRNQLKEFGNAPDDMLSSKVEEKTNINNLIERFEKLKIKIRREKIDISDFKIWVDKFSEMNNFYKDHGDVKIEKLLEHYLSTKHLNINKNDTYIDVASSSSPFAEIISNHFGNISYSQDLIFNKGINGNKIGGDASNIPVNENFADILSLQCAFECFQDNSDINFIKEAGRILKPNGRLGIIPLYIDNDYFVKTGPKCDKRKIKVEKEAKWIWRDDSWQSEAFSRHYSPESFKNRIYNNMIEMNGEILYFTNLDEVMKTFTNQKIYCHFMFRATKK